MLFLLYTYFVVVLVVVFPLQVKRQTQQFLFVELLMVNDNRQVCSFLLPLPSSYLPPPHLLPPLPSHALSSLSPLTPIFLQSLHSNHVTYVFPQYINMGSDLTATVNRDLVIVNTMDTVRRSLANTHSKSYFYLYTPLFLFSLLSLFFLSSSHCPTFPLFVPPPLLSSPSFLPLLPLSFILSSSFILMLPFISLPPSLSPFLFPFSFSLSFFFFFFPLQTLLRYTVILYTTYNKRTTEIRNCIHMLGYNTAQ